MPMIDGYDLRSVAHGYGGVKVLTLLLEQVWDRARTCTKGTGGGFEGRGSEIEGEKQKD